MRKYALLSVLVVFCYIQYSCNDDDFEYESSFKQSYAAWIDFKAESDNSYEYTTVESSWVGLAWQTTITVDKGEIIRRHFKFTFIPEGFEVKEQEWIEDKENIGSHGDDDEIITLDVVYDKAKNDWLKKRKRTETFFEVDNKGLISLCGYREFDCQDDCFRGIRIKEIKALK